MPMPFRALTVPVVLLSGLLAACGGGDGAGGTSSEGASSGRAATEAERPYVDAFVVDFTSAESPPTSEAEAECFGLRLVRLLGAEELEAKGVTPDEFGAAESAADLDVDVPDDAAEQLSTALTDCFDDLVGIFGAGLTAQGGEAAQCLVENVDEGRLADAAARSFIGEGDAEQAITQAMVADMTPACAEQQLLRAGVESGDITEEVATCIADGLDDEVALRAIRSSASGGQPEPRDTAAIQAATAGCR